MNWSYPDWSVPAWAEKEPVEIRHKDGFKSAQFFNVERDFSIPAPQDFDATDPVGPEDPDKPDVPPADGELGPLILNGEVRDISGNNTYFYDVTLTGLEG